MSKEIIPELVAREQWMTEELQEKLRQAAPEGKISCSRAHRFAHDQSIELEKMNLLLDLCNIRLKECQLGCF